MSERDRMFGSTQGKGDNQRPTDLKKYRDRFPKGMGKKPKPYNEKRILGKAKKFFKAWFKKYPRDGEVDIL